MFVNFITIGGKIDRIPVAIFRETIFDAIEKKENMSFRINSLQFEVDFNEESKHTFSCCEHKKDGPTPKMVALSKNEFLHLIGVDHWNKPKLS